MALTKVTSGMVNPDPTDASNLSSGDVPLAQLDNVDTSGITANQDDIALLGFKVAANGSLAKYNLVDQTIDAFEDASGVDASASTNETRDSSNYYSGKSTGSIVNTTYSYTGSTASLAAQSGVVFTIKTWGAGGGIGSGSAAPVQRGGAGGFSTGTYSFGADTTLIIAVGGDGPRGQDSGTGGWPGGGNRGNYDTSGGYLQGGSNGGGYSGVFIGAQAHANSLQIAGGGGGGFYYSLSTGTNGGAGGGTSGQDTVGGTGGSQSAGGSGAPNGPAGSALQGGNGGSASPSGGGGGGGGYYGGAGGGGWSYSTTSGAGGSGFVATTATINSIAVTAESVGATTASSGTSMNGTGSSDSNYPGGTTGNEGNDGAVFISHTPLTYEDMTLVSNATTAVDGAPTTGDLVITYTDGAGTATVNTDIKAYISRDGSAYTSAVTLVSQGTTGGHNILTANGVDLSGIASGTSMRWKIETLNQSAAKQTRVQAVSLGWS